MRKPSAVSRGSANAIVKRRLSVFATRSEEHTSELQSHSDLVCRLLLEKKKKKRSEQTHGGVASRHVLARVERGLSYAEEGYIAVTCRYVSHVVDASVSSILQVRRVCVL